MPPNVYLTGPLLDGRKDGTKLRKADPVLADWVDDAVKNDEYIFYISLGSEVQ